jgi:hypothetical protein
MRGLVMIEVIILSLCLLSVVFAIRFLKTNVFLFATIALIFSITILSLIIAVESKDDAVRNFVFEQKVL